MVVPPHSTYLFNLFLILNSEVLRQEREDLHENSATLTALVAKDEESLEGIDSSILKKLTQAAASMLDNEELLAGFYEAKVKFQN